MSEVFVGLDMQPEEHSVTIMKNDLIGEVVKEKEQTPAGLSCVNAWRMSLKEAKLLWNRLVSVGPELIFSRSSGFRVLLANPLEVKMRTEDIKNDKVDSKTLAELVEGKLVAKVLRSAC